MGIHRHTYIPQKTQDTSISQLLLEFSFSRVTQTLSMHSRLNTRNRSPVMLPHMTAGQRCPAEASGSCSF